MSSTEIEFRERLDSMENGDEVPAHLDPKTINERVLLPTYEKKKNRV